MRLHGFSGGTGYRDVINVKNVIRSDKRDKREIAISALFNLNH